MPSILWTSNSEFNGVDFDRILPWHENVYNYYRKSKKGY